MSPSSKLRLKCWPEPLPWMAVARSTGTELAGVFIVAGRQGKPFRSVPPTSCFENRSFQSLHHACNSRCVAHRQKSGWLESRLNALGSRRHSGPPGTKWWAGFWWTASMVIFANTVESG